MQLKFGSLAKRQRSVLSAKPSRSPRQSRPGVEPLEDRVVFTASSWTLLETPGPLLAHADRLLARQLSSVGAKATEKVNAWYQSLTQQVQHALASPAADAAAFADWARTFNQAYHGWARVNDRGDIQTYIQVSRGENLEAFQKKLQALHIPVEASNEALRVVQAWVPVNRVTELAQLGAVSSLRLPDYARHRTGSVNSAGDALHKADAVRNSLGFDGTGVRIGVISDGIDHRAQVTASPYLDLPATITVDPDHPGQGDEGTAMLEIVYDLAPGASLYFSGNPSTGTSLDMINSITWLVGQGVTVIVDDIGFAQEPFFADGPVAQAVAAAVARGVTYVTAAGNEALDHYQAPYVQGGDSGEGFWHDFGGGDIGQTVLIPPAGTFAAVLQWSDSFTGSSNDYDMYLAGSLDNTILAFSDQVQDGTQAPLEILVYTNSTSSDLLAFIAINKFQGSARELELYTLGDFGQQYNTPGDSIVGQAAVPAVLTVGALNALDPGSDDIAIYSSRGPSTIYTDFTTQTSIRRDSLDGVGIDEVETKIGQLGFIRNPFLGTSAAAAHVAGLAALLKQANPNLRPFQLATALSDTAVDLTKYGTGYDPTSGFGLFNVLDAVNKVLAPGDPILDPGSDTSVSHTDRDGATEGAEMLPVLNPSREVYRWAEESRLAAAALRPVTSREVPAELRPREIDFVFTGRHHRRADDAGARSWPAGLAGDFLDNAVAALWE